MFAESFSEVLLSRGVVDASGVRHRQAWLRPLTGWQEAALGALPCRIFGFGFAYSCFTAGASSVAAYV